MGLVYRNQQKIFPDFIYLVVSIIFYFHPYLGKISILTNIFQMGWNHQPVMVFLPILSHIRYPAATSRQVPQDLANDKTSLQQLEVKWHERVAAFGFVWQGSVNYPIVGRMKQCKGMVTSRGFPL